MTRFAGFRGVTCLTCRQVDDSGPAEVVDAALRSDGTIDHWAHVLSPDLDEAHPAVPAVTL